MEIDKNTEHLLNEDEKEIIMSTHVTGGNIAIDNTDHMGFYCPRCHKIMKIIEVYTKNVFINYTKKEKDKCTFIRLICRRCNTSSHRKFYWKSEDGRYLYYKTEL